MKSTPRMLITLQTLFAKHGLNLSVPGSALSLINEPYMPLSIDVQYEMDSGIVLTMCHWYIQNGDWMDDPRIDFLWVRDEKHIKASNLVPGLYPIYYENDGLGLYQELVTFENGKPTKFSPKAQASATSFCQMWATNLRQQGFQGDDVTIKTCVDGLDQHEDDYDTPDDAELPVAFESWLVKEDSNDAGE